MSSIRAYLSVAMIAIIGICTSNVSAQGSIQIPDDVKKHIPADAFLLVYTPSLGKLVDSVEKTASMVDPSMGMQAKMMPMMMATSILKYEDPKMQPELDMSKPAMLAVTGTGMSPMVTAMFGIKSSHKGLESADPTMKVESISEKGMVVLSMGDKSKSIASDAALLQNIPAGQISVAFDQELFVKKFGPMIEMMLAMSTGAMGQQKGKMTEAERQSMQQAQQAAKQAKAFMGMFKSWDMAMDFNGGLMDTTVRWIPTSSKMNPTGSADMGNFTHVMAQNPAMAGIFSLGCLRSMLNMDEMADMSMVPEGMVAMIKKIYKDADAIADNIDSSTGFSYGLDSKGLWGMQSLKVKSIDTFMSQVKAMMTTIQDAKMGITVKDLKMIDPGVGYTLHLDMQTMMDSMGMGSMISSKEMAQMDAVVDAMMGGEVGMQIRYMHKDNHVIAVFGRNGKVVGSAKRILKSGEKGTPNVLDSLVSTAQGTPTMVMTMDMRSGINDLLALLNSIPAMQADMADALTSMPAGDPVRLDLTATAMTKGGQCVVSFDLGGMAQMIMKADEEMNAKKQNKAAMAN
ncbi:MAG: hypothetical protein P8J89_04400 [Phycisphaerales bacterium]|nr:hypothetical protein [Phycisphaerales bacterium]